MANIFVFGQRAYKPPQAIRLFVFGGVGIATGSLRWRETEKATPYNSQASRLQNNRQVYNSQLVL